MTRAQPLPNEGSRNPRDSRRRSAWLLALGLTCCWQACTFPDFRTPYATDAEGADGGAATTSSAGAPDASGAGVGGATVGGEPSSQADAGAGGQPPEAGVLAGHYRLVAKHSSKCMDAAGETADAEVTIAQHACDSSRPQAFTLVDDGVGYYTLAIQGSGDCVDVQGHATANQTPLIRAACDGGPSQAWLPVAQDDGSYFLVNRLTTKCLDVPAKSLDDVVLQQYTCNIGGNQRWVLASLDPRPLPLVVDDFFVPEPWSNPDQAPTSMSASRAADACDGERAPGAQGDCHRISLDTFPSGTTHAGATWLYPRHSWGYLPGLVIAPGAQRVRLQARGAHGGEKLLFKAGGVGGNTFVDGFAVDLVAVELTTSWQTVSLDLTGKAYADGVISAFAWRLEQADNSAPVTFYLDDLVWE